MKDQIKISDDIQEIFLSVLKQNIPPQRSAVDVISDLLEISQDAAYRRLRGDKRFDIDEIFTISKTYNISLDTIFSVKSQGTIFNYTNLDVRDKAKYLLYLQRVAQSIELLKEGRNSEIILSAIDIPVFHFLPYTELTLFKLFAWNNTVYNQGGYFEDFLEEFLSPDLTTCYHKMADDYSLVPSTELWTVNTIDTVIRLIDFYFETGYFRDRETPTFLCNQVIQLVDNLKVWVERGYKKTPSVTYSFYVSDTDLENNFVLLKKDSQLTCLLKLFTINSLTTKDECFCKETYHWLETSKKRSVLLTGASERDRFRYFNALQQKIRFMTEKFAKADAFNPSTILFGKVQGGH